MLQKIKQQLIDNVVLLTIVIASLIGSRPSQVNVCVKELVDMQQKISNIEAAYANLIETQNDLDDLRLELAKHLSGQPIKKK